MCEKYLQYVKLDRIDEVLVYRCGLCDATGFEKRRGIHLHLTKTHFQKINQIKETEVEEVSTDLNADVTQLIRNYYMKDSEIEQGNINKEKSAKKASMICRFCKEDVKMAHSNFKVHEYLCQKYQQYLKLDQKDDVLVYRCGLCEATGFKKRKF